MNRKIIISINSAWNIYNFRRGLIGGLAEQGYQVVALAPEDDYAERLKQSGCRFISLDMDCNGTHLARDLSLLKQYYQILRKERPIAYLGYTVKPNVYGSLAAHALGIPVVNNIAGLGTTFINQGVITWVVKLLYRLALSRSHRVFFQNPEDMSLFTSMGLVRAGLTDCLPGSGMDLSRFQPLPGPDEVGRPFRFLLISRVLRDKGIAEFAAAAVLVRRHYPNSEFHLLGPIDAANPNSISLETIRKWETESTFRHIGMTDDVRPHIRDADCVVLPSYREGLPRSLLEAAAMARPLIATDATGCREVVEDNVNGFLCKVRDGADLAEKMVRMMSLAPERRLEMGLAGRRKVEAHFDEKLVIQKYLAALNSVKPDRTEKMRKKETSLSTENKNKAV
jgi:glycosyltransferase involved in cell wall biosynthesis